MEWTSIFKMFETLAIVIILLSLEQYSRHF